MLGSVLETPRLREQKPASPKPTAGRGVWAGLQRPVFHLAWHQRTLLVSIMRWLETNLRAALTCNNPSTHLERHPEALQTALMGSHACSIIRSPSFLCPSSPQLGAHRATFASASLPVQCLHICAMSLQPWESPRGWSSEEPRSCYIFSSSAPQRHWGPWF